jgi:hypothetical protein
MDKPLEQFDVRKLWTSQSVDAVWMHPLGLFYSPEGGNSDAVISTIHSIRDKFALSILFVPDEEYRTAYGNLFEDRCIFVGDDALAWKRIMKSVRNTISEQKRSGIEERHIQALIVIDHCPKISRSKFARLAVLGLNLNNWTILIRSKGRLLSTAIIENCDFFMANAEEDPTTRQRLYDYFWSDLSKQQFDEMYNTTSKENGSLVWTNNVHYVDNEFCRYFSFKPTHCAANTILQAHVDIEREADS